MSSKVLKNKPLVEAIFELKWLLPEKDGVQTDPNYKLLIGRLYERIKENYPYHEELPTATLPDEVSSYLIQHRFRKDKDNWPLIQLGPGILTLNDTENYSFDDFQKRISSLLLNFMEMFAEGNKPQISNLILRYIDAIEFDYSGKNILDFLQTALKTKVEMPNTLFENKDVNPQPAGINIGFSFSCNKPKSTKIGLKFGKGAKKDGVHALMWETLCVTQDKDACGTVESVQQWVKEAHDLTDRWFFTLIEGELLKRFE